MRTIEEIAKLFCLCAEVGDKCESCSANEDGCRCSDLREYNVAKRAIEKAQEWISVEDELPEDRRYVIVTENIKAIPRAQYIAWYLKSENEWVLQFNSYTRPMPYASGSVIEGVTHWRELLLE